MIWSGLYFCCWYIDLRCHLDLWPLTLNICSVSPVTWWKCTKFERNRFICGGVSAIWILDLINLEHVRSALGYFNLYTGNSPFNQINLTKIGVWVGVVYVINHTKFDNDRSKEYKVTQIGMKPCSIEISCHSCAACDGCAHSFYELYNINIASFEVPQVRHLERSRQTTGHAHRTAVMVSWSYTMLLWCAEWACQVMSWLKIEKYDGKKQEQDDWHVHFSFTT